MPATASKKKVSYVVPTRMMKSVEITQEEYDKYYESTVNNNSYSISKETLKQNLLQIVNQKKRLKITDGHPFIREMLWRMEDNPIDESALDMVVMMIETNTQKSIHPLNDPINIPHQIKAMLRQTPEPDNELMIEEEEEDPDEEPPGCHTTKKEGEKAQLDALYPTTRVFSDNEKQKTTNRMSTIHEGTHNEDVLTVTFQENVVINNNQIHMMSAMYENTYQEDMLPVTIKENVVIENYQKHTMSAMHENTYQEDVLPVTFKEDVIIENYKKYTMSAMHETTYQEEVDAKTYMENVVVPRAVANTSSGNDDPDDPQHNCMMGKTGTKDDTKRLAVTAITSERGGRGA
jgi:hypothetical protein